MCSVRPAARLPGRKVGCGQVTEEAVHLHAQCLGGPAADVPAAALRSHALRSTTGPAGPWPVRIPAAEEPGADVPGTAARGLAGREGAVGSRGGVVAVAGDVRGVVTRPAGPEGRDGAARLDHRLTAPSSSSSTGGCSGGGVRGRLAGSPVSPRDASTPGRPRGHGRASLSLRGEEHRGPASAKSRVAVIPRAFQFMRPPSR